MESVETLPPPHFPECDNNNGFRPYTLNIWEEGIGTPGKTYQINLVMRMDFSEAGVCTCPTCHQKEDDDDDEAVAV